MRILFAASEMEPYASTGGMGDVIGSLPQALASLGARVAVVLPRYGMIDPDKLNLKPYGDSERTVKVNGKDRKFSLLRTSRDGVDVYFVEQPAMFNRPQIYGTTDKEYPDNAERFITFTRAALQLADSMRPRPDIIHFHDWHTALGPVYMARDKEISRRLRGSAAVLTIHNLGYQGIFPGMEMITAGLGPELFNQDALEFWGKMNFLKGGIVFSDALIAVSPRYAEEIQTEEFGFGLEGTIRDHADRLTGILNGADYSRWNPETDRNIPSNYSRRAPRGKIKCKLSLQTELGLAEDPGVPLVGMVTRLVEQKGLELLVESIDSLMKHDVQFAVLGLGAEKFHKKLRSFATRWPDRFAAVIAFNEPLSHRIEAGSDIFLMPSRYEPCGLNQIYSLKYGTVPVVRATGGLDDTVIDANADPVRGNGFKFTKFEPKAMAARLGRAISLYHHDLARWRQIVDNAFKANFSWGVSARSHMKVYRRALQRKSKGLAAGE